LGVKFEFFIDYLFDLASQGFCPSPFKYIFKPFSYALLALHQVMHLSRKLFQTNLKITNGLSSKLLRVEQEDVELGVDDWKLKDRVHSDHFFIKLDQVLNRFNKRAFA
jgi:hypothetical protein